MSGPLMQAGVPPQEPDGAYWLHPTDAQVIEDPHAQCLADEEGLRLFNFPKSWTHMMIAEALRFANMAYAKGHHAGARAKVREIQRALTCD